MDAGLNAIVTGLKWGVGCCYGNWPVYPVLRFLVARRIQLISVILAAGCGVCLRAASSRLIVCGSAQVIEGSVARQNGKPSLKIDWIWRPEKSLGLPVALMSNFAGTDECKPVEGGKYLLITSSSNALALVDQENGGTVYYANVRNAHSAALLPNNFIAVASSFSPDNSGNRVLLFDMKVPDHAVAFLPLAGAHGVEWDQDRQVLWALGDRELQRIHVETGSEHGPAMTVQQVFPLPSRGGHDLVLANDKSALYVVTGTEVLVFGPQDGKFSPFPPFAGQSNVKSLSINDKTGQIVYTQADWGVWWTYTLRFRNPGLEIELPEHAYKVRWLPDRKSTPIQGLPARRAK